MGWRNDKTSCPECGHWRLAHGRTRDPESGQRTGWRCVMFGGDPNTATCTCEHDFGNE